MNNKPNFNIDSNISITGDLTVNGTTQTINQETLTVKDNLIAVNGNGTILDTVGVAGIVAVTGQENFLLKDGNYSLNPQAIYEFLGSPTAIITESGLYGFNIKDEGLNQKVEKLNNLNIYITDPYGAYLNVPLKFYFDEYNLYCQCEDPSNPEVYASYYATILSVDTIEGEIIIDSFTPSFDTKNQIVNNEESQEILRTILLNSRKRR